MIDHPIEDQIDTIEVLREMATAIVNTEVKDQNEMIALIEAEIDRIEEVVLIEETEEIDREIETKEQTETIIMKRRQKGRFALKMRSSQSIKRNSKRCQLNIDNLWLVMIAR